MKRKLQPLLLLLAAFFPFAAGAAEPPVRLAILVENPPAGAPGKPLANSFPSTNGIAGLGPVPQWTNSDQLRAKWGGCSLLELRAEAEKGNIEAEHYLGWLYNTGQGVQTNDALAAEWYRKAATGGFPLAQNNLGLLYERGSGVTNDLAEAVRWFHRAADQGLPVALMNLGRLCASEASPEFNPGNARLYYEQAAERGNTDAAIQLGRLFNNPPGGGTIEWQRAGYWFAFAAEHGAVMAYNQLGWLYISQADELHDLGEARRWFSKGADQNEPYCELGLAMLELYEHKTSPDLALVRRWMLKAADKNISPALFQLGRLSELNNIPHGPEVKPDYNEAARWYQRAVDAGNTAAVSRLAELTAAGRIGQAKDVLPRLQRASDLGDVNARLDLALLYLKSEARPRNPGEEPMVTIRELSHAGVTRANVLMADFYRQGKNAPRDPVKAIRLLWRAANVNNETALNQILDLKNAALEQRKPAKFNEGLEEAYGLFAGAMFDKRPAPALLLARRYLDGTYPVDEVEACAWFSLAAERGDAGAATERDRLLDKLSPTEKTEAKNRASELWTDSANGIRPL